MAHDPLGVYLSLRAPLPLPQSIEETSSIMSESKESKETNQKKASRVVVAERIGALLQEKDNKVALRAIEAAGFLCAGQ